MVATESPWGHLATSERPAASGAPALAVHYSDGFALLDGGLPDGGELRRHKECTSRRYDALGAYIHDGSHKPRRRAILHLRRTNPGDDPTGRIGPTHNYLWYGDGGRPHRGV